MAAENRQAVRAISSGLQGLNLNADVVSHTRFFDLPAELRRKLYRILLLNESNDCEYMNENFLGDEGAWSPNVPSRPVRGPAGTLNALCPYRFTYPRSIFAVNRQIREEALDVVYSARLTWIVFRTNIPDYAAQLIAAGFPIGFTGPIDKIKHPVVSVEFSLPAKSPNYSCSFAIKLTQILELVRAINVTAGKSTGALKAVFHDVKNAKGKAHRTIAVITLAEHFGRVYGLKYAEVTGIDNLENSKDIGMRQDMFDAVQQRLHCTLQGMTVVPEYDFVLRILQDTRETGVLCCKNGEWRAGHFLYVTVLMAIRDFANLHPDRFEIVRRIQNREETGPINMMNLFVSNAGLCLYNLGRHEDAIRMNKVALLAFAHVPRWEAKAFYRIAMALVAMGDYSQASANLFEASKLQPNDVTIKEELNKLKQHLQE